MNKFSDISFLSMIHKFFIRLFYKFDFLSMEKCPNFQLLLIDFFLNFLFKIGTGIPIVKMTFRNGP
jgi:hypothetical protein